MIYNNYQRNHVIIPGREIALKKFLNQSYGKLKGHKLKNGINSNSEDALTWSCFDFLAHYSFKNRNTVLDEIMEDSFEGKCNFKFKTKNYSKKDIEIYVGKKYTGLANKGNKKEESTEVDASIELPDKLFFFEAKLYSSISLATSDKPHDQIVRKLRVGLDCAECINKEFYFIFLDIAPAKKLMKFTKEKKNKENASNELTEKWKSAWWFFYYKNGRNKSLKPLRESLDGIKIKSVQSVADNMGWLTWSDLYKNIVRGIL
jgi:hypothetical protein